MDNYEYPESLPSIILENHKTFLFSFEHSLLRFKRGKHLFLLKLKNYKKSLKLTTLGALQRKRVTPKVAFR